MKINSRAKIAVAGSGVTVGGKIFILIPLGSFFVSLVGYLMTLAPTVTFEDSGELITAAYHLGIPHAPGYPLYTVLGRMFTLLPLDPVAYRMNFMSAFFSALAAMTVTWMMLHLLPMIFGEPESGRRRFFIAFSALFTGLMFAASYELWEQSVITEVYSLHAFLMALLMALSVQWLKTDSSSHRDRIFYFMAYLFGLGLGNHHTLLLILPAVGLLIIARDRRVLINGKRLAAGSALFLAGLTIYAYLPVASLRNPVMDWGNPETWNNFWLTITRHQYQVTETRSMMKYLGQLSYYGTLIVQQWWPVLLLPAVIGCVTAFMKQRTLAVFLLMILAITGPLTLFLTNLDIAESSPVIADENRMLVSVFYIPSYMILAVLSGIGIYDLWRRLAARTNIQYGFIIIIGSLLIAVIHGNYKKLDMSRYYFAEQYSHNLFSVVKPNALVLTNYDPFYFTTVYYQFVENRRTDITVIDINLIKNSWYIDWLRLHHPTLMERHNETLISYEAIIRKAERDDAIHPLLLSERYLQLINAILDTSWNVAKPVYLTFDPPEGIATKYYQISCVSVIELLTNPRNLTTLYCHHFQLDDYLDESIPQDRMARFFKSYYGRLLYARGYILEAVGRKTESVSFYQKALEFMKQDKEWRPQIEKALKRVGMQ